MYLVMHLSYQSVDLMGSLRYHVQSVGCTTTLGGLQLVPIFKPDYIRTRLARQHLYTFATLFIIKMRIGSNATTVAFLFMFVSFQSVMATFSGRELLSKNHTGMKNFTGLDYLSIRLDTSSPIKNFASSASSDSTRGGLWKKHRKDRGAPQGTVSGPSNNDGLLQGFDGEAQQLVPPVMSPEDLKLLEKKKDLLLDLLKETEDQLSAKT